MSSTRVERLNEAFNYLRFKGLVKTQKDLAEAIGATAPNVSSALKGDEKFLTDSFIVRFSNVFKEVSSHWLLTGEGEMLKNEKEDKPTLIPSNPQEGIPLIPASAMAGALLGFQEIDHSELTFYKIPSFRGAEYLISIRGDSMIPKYLSGDLVACRNVPLNNLFFQWGKTYVLDTEQGALIKRVERAEEEGSVLLVSENPNYKPFSIPIIEIYHIAMIVGVIRGE